MPRGRAGAKGQGCWTPIGFRRRVRDAHLHDAPPGAGAGRRAGLRQGAEEPWGKNTTLLSSMTHEGMEPRAAVVGSTTGSAFASYVEQVLAPTLGLGICDGARQPRRPQGRAARGGEGLWAVVLAALFTGALTHRGGLSKVKALLRRAAARTREALAEVIVRSSGDVVARDARGWFVCCVYAVWAQSS